MTIKVKAVLPPVIMLLFGVALLLIIPEQISRGGSTSFVNPRFIPYLLGWTIVGLSVISIIATFITPKNVLKEEEETEEEETQPNNIKRVIAVFITIVLWPIIIPHLGFVITTVLLLISLMYFMGHKSKIQILIVAIVATAVLYVGIKVLMKVPLPSGIFM